ncbi:MAG: STAS domain-containing protein [Planctomycetaceae bacterium]|nr:STAS domain-containing protein [Planctomycetaceae bacterium]
MAVQQSPIEVYQAGELTVLGFGGQSVLDHIDLGEARAEIAELVSEHNCRNLAFDLTGVRLMPSGMLGLLASLRQLGVEVHLYNPSEDIREVLELTRLDQLMHLHQVDVE